MSAFGGKADMAFCTANASKADISNGPSPSTSEAAELEPLDYARGRLMIVASGFGKLE
jgi:hypothetical protein